MGGFDMPKCHAAVLMVAEGCSKQTFLRVTLLEKSFFFFFPPLIFSNVLKDLKAALEQKCHFGLCLQVCHLK